MNTEYIHSFKFRFAAYLIAPTAAFIFFSSFSPFSSEGTVVKENILIGAILLASALFSTLHLLLKEVLSSKRATGLSGLYAATITEIFLLSSLSLVSAWSIAAAGLFNLVVYWYSYRRFKV